MLRPVRHSEGHVTWFEGDVVDIALVPVVQRDHVTHPAVFGDVKNTRTAAYGATPLPTWSMEMVHNCLTILIEKGKGTYTLTKLQTNLTNKAAGGPDNARLVRRPTCPNVTTTFWV